MGVYVINLHREICKPVLKLVFLRRIAQWSSSRNLDLEVRLMLFWKLRLNNKWELCKLLKFWSVALFKKLIKTFAVVFVRHFRNISLETKKPWSGNCYDIENPERLRDLWEKRGCVTLFQLRQRGFVNSESTATEILQISMYSILETKALAFIHRKNSKLV